MLMQNQLNFVILYVRDIAAMRDFYAKTFDLKLEANAPTFVQFVADGGAIFALLPGEHPTPTATIELWWEVADVDAAHARLASQGVEIVSGPEDKPFGRTLSIKDPEGNLANLYRLRQA
jgi:lactoylglutathione lyase